MTINHIHAILNKLKTQLELKGIDTSKAKILDMSYSTERSVVFEYRKNHEVGSSTNLIESIVISLYKQERDAAELLDYSGEFIKKIQNTEGVISDETDDDDFKAGYELAALLEQYPREYCGCKTDCATCIQYAVTVLSDETPDDIPLRFRIM